MSARRSPRSSSSIEERELFKRDIAAVDLRLLDRISVRLRDGASATTPGGTPQLEVPTASTKITPVKGKT